MRACLLGTYYGGDEREGWRLDHRRERKLIISQSTQPTMKQVINGQEMSHYLLLSMLL
jgi:hypothetical protein